MDNEKKTTEQTVVENALTNGQNVTVTILKGNVAEPITIHAPKSVDIKGTIDAPSRFAEVRDFEQKKSHTLVSVDRGEIKMIVNEQETDNTWTVTGRVIIGKLFAKLGINGTKTYTPEELAKEFKLRRNLFESRAQHATVIKSLRDIKAKVNQSIEKAKDDRANVTDAFTQTVESNVPENITLMIPLIEGQDAVKIVVDLILEADGQNIICYLESADAAEGIEEYKARIIHEEVDKLKEKTTIIFE